MMQDRKYFGMTVQQLGILGGLAVFACLLFGVTGWLFLRRGLGLISQSPPDAPIIGLTSTPFMLPTLSPTATLTPIPYEQLIPAGWIQHRTTLVELWLPPGFESTGTNANSAVSGNSVVQELSLAGESASANKIYVSVSYEPLPAGSLDAFIDSRLSNMPPEVNMSERRKVSINSTEVYRLMLEWQDSSVYTNDLFFIFLDGSTIWYVKYSAEIKDFYEMLSIFEESIKTFRIVR